MDKVNDLVTRWLEGLLTADEAMSQLAVLLFPETVDAE
jgi:hypothetical protein